MKNSLNVSQQNDSQTHTAVLTAVARNQANLTVSNVASSNTDPTHDQRSRTGTGIAKYSQDPYRASAKSGAESNVMSNR